MKKLMILVVILSAGFANAQRVERDLTPEQMASVQSKKMTLALDLDAKQQSKVEKLLLINAKERKANKLSKEDRAALTSNQKFALAEQMLEKKIEVKREMKSILSTDQYAKWEELMAKRGDKRTKGDRNKKRNRRDREN